jgi:hypothetical protein
MAHELKLFFTFLKFWAKEKERDRGRREGRNKRRRKQ